MKEANQLKIQKDLSIVLEILTVINVRKFTKFVYYEGNVKFDDNNNVFE